MTRNIEIVSELQSISQAVANIGAQMPYDLPAGYFQNLSEVIMARISAGGIEENTVVEIAGKSSPFTVPENYFEQLSSSILDKIKFAEETSPIKELKELSPLLAGISKKNVYSVPEGYFDSLSTHVSSSLKPQVIVVSFTSRKTLLRLAVAASFLVMLTFGAYLLFTRPAAQTDSYVKLGLKKYNTDAQIDKGLQSISEADLLTYLQRTSEGNDDETIATIVTGEDLNETSTEPEEEEDVLLESILNELENIPEAEIKTNTN
jgi:hypothetical protein